MSVVERLWWSAHGVDVVRWELFQLAAIVAGGVAVARARDGKLVRAYAVGVVLAVLGAIALGGGIEWAAFFARGARGQMPELEVAGLGAIGGLLAGYLAVARFGYRRAKSAWAALDVLAPAIGAMVMIARLGCFFAGCDFGAPTNVPWALRYPPLTPAFRAQVEAGLLRTTDLTTMPVHPTQLYESFAGLVALALALAWPGTREDSCARTPGARFSVTLGVYLAARFAIDFLRGDLTHGALGLTTTQWLVIAAGAALVSTWSSRSLRRAAAPRRRDDPPSSPGSRRSSPPTAAS
ncbi:MAG: prolipoprotein diacylglyceryl transferase [Deltaproteobacteria bacterium]|nr:prolipoprotein diacylglyceryl transferase [Deltaproteobacteria bacterium]